MRKKIKVVLCPALLLALIVSAQIPDASRQVENVQQHRPMENSFPAGTNAAPELYPGETSDVGPQSVLQIKPRRTYLEASADVQYFYDNNMFLAGHGAQDADVLVSTVQAAFAPTPYEFQGGLLAPRLGYQHQWFNYELIGTEKVYALQVGHGFGDVNLDAFDFNVSTVFGDVAWSREQWTFSLGMDYRRLLDSDSYDEFYHEFVPRWFVRRDFSVCDSLALSAAYEGDFRATETAPPVPGGYSENFNDRTDHSLVLSGSYRLCQFAFLQPYYRFEFTHYTEIDRDDFLNSFGLALYCPVTKQINLRAFVGYDNLNTDGAYSQNYDQISAGGGLNLSVHF